MKRTQSADELPQFKNTTNAHLFPKNYEVNTMPSETIPDQTMSMTEILRRFASGLPLGASKVEMYDGGEDDIYDGINPATLDLAEKQQIADMAKQELQEIQNRMNDRKERELTKKQQKAWEKQQKMLEQQQQNEQNTNKDAQS
ncbi:MAG: hypothetical protein [Arizlama microvirus]|nr:MAG: hypothetical protein [Arizlama microvirus]